MDGVYVVFERNTAQPLWIYQDAVTATLKAASQAANGEGQRQMRVEYVPFDREVFEYLRLR